MHINILFVFGEYKQEIKNKSSAFSKSNWFIVLQN